MDGHNSRIQLKRVSMDWKISQKELCRIKQAETNGRKLKRGRKRQDM